MKKFILILVALATCFISCNKEKEANVSPTEIPATETFRLKFSCDFNEQGLKFIHAYYDAIGFSADRVAEDQYEEVTITANDYQSAVDSFLILMSKAEATIGNSLDNINGTYVVKAFALSKGEVVYENSYGKVDNGSFNLAAHIFHKGYKFSTEPNPEYMPSSDTYVQDFHVDHFRCSENAAEFFGNRCGAYHSLDCNQGAGAPYVVISIITTHDPNEAVTDAFIYCNNSGKPAALKQIYNGVEYQAALELDSDCCKGKPTSLNYGCWFKKDHDLYLYYTKDHKYKQVIRSRVGLPYYRREEFHKWDIKWREGEKLPGYQQFCHGTPWYNVSYNPNMKLEQRDFGKFDDNSGVDLNRKDGEINSEYVYLLFQFRWMGDEPWKVEE